LLGIRFIPSQDQVADGFTKALAAQQLEEFKHNFFKRNTVGETPTMILFLNNKNQNSSTISTTRKL
jgi:hypothetical protein